ncbi:MAG: Pseudouridine synthase [Candidatus Woesebacteria bacterium GW2011_GWB1_45_5]|uniref:Pseudouridine synthase n=1 Tax=Candidatus Woesebacteria bacterium GW2011_GWB1_45_5 TaxID=1618581 RepID=A0A0G1PVB5_9BACT|nr:MAG: Pseudouridine synthase [Candidatus Woesebacteria bacterium GW2011_GWB1_45_5]
MQAPKIIHQDDSLFVIDKPSGWITNEADTTTTQPVIQTWLRENFNYPLKGDREMRDGIVHRLDKETSGVLIVAKTKEAFEKLQAGFKNREVEKTYIGLLHGKVEPPEGKIEATVGRLPWRRDRFGVLSGGRESVSEYKVLKFYPGNNGGHSLVEFYPKTGRTHQIRIHAKHIGHAIVADEFYAGRKTARNDRKWCPRLFLHASAIKFTHPAGGKPVEFESKLPDDLQGALNVLEKVRETN